MNINHCGSCGLYRSIQKNQNKICIIDHQPHEPDYYCGNHTNQPTICDMCGCIILDRRGIITKNKTDNFILICEDCYNTLGTCGTCTQDCSLEKDNTMPRTVMKTVRQGNMTMQTQVLNPDLVAKHCPSCKCYRNNQCLRQKGSSCDKYESVIS